MNTDPNTPIFSHQNALLPLHMCDLGRSPSPESSTAPCRFSTDHPASTSLSNDTTTSTIKATRSTSPLNFLIPDPLFGSTDLLTRTATQSSPAHPGVPHFIYDNYNERPSHVNHCPTAPSNTYDSKTSASSSSIEIFAPTPIHSTTTSKQPIPTPPAPSQVLSASQTGAPGIFSTHYQDTLQVHLAPPSSKTKEAPRAPSRNAPPSCSSVPAFTSPTDLFSPYFRTGSMSYVASRVNLKKLYEIYLNAYTIANAAEFGSVRQEIALHISLIIETIILELFPIIDTLYLTLTIDLSDEEIDLFADPIGSGAKGINPTASNALANNAELFCIIAPIRKALKFLLSSQPTYTLRPLPAFFSLYQMNADYQKTQENFSRSIINAATDSFFKKFSKILQENNEQMDKLVQNENFNMKNPLLTVKFPLKSKPSKPRFLCPSRPCIISTDTVPSKQKSSPREFLEDLTKLDASLSDPASLEPRPFIVSAIANSPDLFSENAFHIFAQLHEFLATSEKKMSLFLTKPIIRGQANLFVSLLGGILYLQNNLFFHHLYRVPHKLSFLKEQIFCASKIFFKFVQTYKSSFDANQACERIAGSLWKLSQILD